jgi:hypothetical protein
MNVDLYLEKYNELISNKFINDFFITRKIQCGLYFIENFNFELRCNIDKNTFIDLLFNSCRLIRFFYLNDEETNIFRWKNYFLKNKNNFNESTKKLIDAIDKLIKHFKKSEVGYLKIDNSLGYEKYLLYFWHGYKSEKFLDEYFNGILFHSDLDNRNRLKDEESRLGNLRKDWQIYQLIPILFSLINIICKIGDLLIVLKNKNQNSGQHDI